MKTIDTDKIPADVFDKIKEKAANKPEPINNTDRVLAFRADGGQILHRRPMFGSRGMTMAFKLKKGRVEIATAVQHRADDFTKKVGTKTAIGHFQDGKTVMLPLRSTRPIDCLKMMMEVLC